MLGQPRARALATTTCAGSASAWTPTAASTTRARSRTAWPAPPHHEFTQLYDSLPDSRDKRFIEALPTWVIERD